MPTREETMALRQAFVSGAYYGSSYGTVNIVNKAAQQYPLPKITRPRVVADCYPSSAATWSARIWKSSGELTIHLRRAENEEWSPDISSFIVDKKRLALFQDLLNNPNETVEDNGTSLPA